MNDQPTSGERIVVGVDLGGTKILAAVVTESGTILGCAKKKSKAQRPQDEILQRLMDCIHDALDDAEVSVDEIQAVGVGSPGPLDPIAGVVLHTPNMNLSEAPIAPFISERLGKPAFLDNDVNVGTLGEHVYGAGKGKSDVVGMFLGTGIGGGIIINGKMLHGKSFNAGEIGHMKIKAYGAKCGCGQRGCLEAYASKTAMIRRFQKAINKKRKTILTEFIGDDWTKLTSNTFLKAYASGDKLVVEEINRAAKYTGVAIGSLINTLSPEVVVIGGGLMEAFGPQLLDPIKEHARNNCFEMIYNTVDIVPSALGDDAGILGAAALAFQRMK